jgi:hypothetical protein
MTTSLLRQINGSSGTLNLIAAGFHPVAEWLKALARLGPFLLLGVNSR